MFLALELYGTELLKIKALQESYSTAVHKSVVSLLDLQ